MRTAVSILSLLLLCAPLGAQPLERCHASLISEDTALVPGKTQTIALRLQMEKDWHVYWMNPGDSGLGLDVKITQAPKELTFGEIQWPAPERYVHEGGDLVDFVHHREVLLLLPVTVAANAQVGKELTVKVRVSWLVCKEACIPGSGEPALTIKVAKRGSARPEHADLFSQTRARLPSPAPDGLTGKWDGTTLVVRARADRLVAFPYLPEEVPPEDAVKHCAGKGPELRIPYSERVRGQQVKLLIALTTGTQTTYHWLSLSAPRKKPQKR